MATTITATDPYGGACPSGRWIDILLNIINNFTTVTLAATSGPTIYKQQSTPTPVTNAIWFRDQTGGTYHYPDQIYGVANGYWVPYSPPPLETFLFFTGDPTNYFGGTGAGLIAPTGELAEANIAGRFFGWQIANGSNGSLNFRSRFPLIAQNYDATVTGGWFANIPQQDGSPDQRQNNGGRDALTLTVGMLPDLWVREYDSAGSSSPPRIYGGTKYTDATGQAVTPREASDVQVAIKDNFPPFRCGAFLQFMGYA